MTRARRFNVSGRAEKCQLHRLRSTVLAHINYTRTTYNQVSVCSFTAKKLILFQFNVGYTGYTQKNGAVSSVSFVHGLEKTHRASFLNRARSSRCTVISDLDTSKRSTQKAFSCCDAILETGPGIRMRSELLVAHEKLGQLPRLVVYIVPV
jgi:hypothetical protein